MKLSEVIDVDWILENPCAAIDLLKCYEQELKQRKDYIKVLEEKLDFERKKSLMREVILEDEKSLKSLSRNNYIIL